VVGRKKILFLSSKEREIGGLQFFFFPLIIMTWKGSLEEKKKIILGTFYCFFIKKLGNVFGKVCLSQV
jgi:hypothetical protein